jgi:hypothetical protein|tara:strand:- start:36 stop:341 length:306 start_codon:yes stop_codon:yes gene_type:complete
MTPENDKANLKIFFVKLIAISLAIIIIISMTYNLIFADKLDMINKLLTLNEKENIEKVKDKIRLEIEKGLSKEKILKEKDAKLLKNFYTKVKKELDEVKTD